MRREDWCCGQNRRRQELSYCGTLLFDQDLPGKDWGGGDVDCATVHLTIPRSSMAITPQEPVMLGGTIRTNLDPFNQYDDETLLDVLHKCLLGHVLQSNPDASTLGESDGIQLLSGNPQLICLARVMPNPSRILLLD
jgi:ABC-type multidrug transport system fused ATPase/permease subunit